MKFLKEFFKPLTVKQCLFYEKEGRATKIYQGVEVFSFSLQLVSLVSPPCSLGSSMFAHLSPLWDTFRYKKCSFSLCDGNFGLFTLAEIFYKLVLSLLGDL